MANNQNLRPFDRMDPEEHRELSRRGGIASGAARREKRDLIKKEKAAKKADDELFQDTIRLYKAIAGATNRRRR